MNKLTGFILALAMLALPVSVYAQAQVSITGTVRDTSGAVLPGVTVEASSDVLTEKVRTAASDSSGQYGSSTCYQAHTRSPSRCQDSRFSNAKASS